MTTALLALMPISPAPADPSAEQVRALYVLMSDAGAVARVIVTDDVCPTLAVDGQALPMTVRAAPAVLPIRSTASTPANSKASEFPATMCEARLPSGARQASVGARPLPLPKPIIRRIVVIGDTGCRLKASGNAYQACNDPQAYPFAAVAAQAAAWRPDLVIHVGDYLYRENPCTDTHPGCADSPWGYGLDSWRADLFTPGAPLFAAAPWVVTRGNHESCHRAGQGWWRLLDPRPLEPRRACVESSDDVTGDWSPPYAVALGQGAQVVVMDLSNAETKAIRPSDPRFAQLVATHDSLARLAKNARFTFAADHYPILGVTAAGGKHKGAIEAGNAAILSAFGAVDSAVIPPGVDVLLAGHVHLWEHVDYGGAAPSQFIAGFSGTQEDVVTLPTTLPLGTAPLPGLAVNRFEAWTNGFGFMTLERTGPTSWNAAVRGVDGRVLHRCRIIGRRSSCGRQESWLRTAVQSGREKVTQIRAPRNPAGASEL